MDSRISRLRDRQIYLGTSSWKYPGWQGWFYQRPYKSQKSFNENCLAEYAEYFSAVGVDHTYYAWPKAEMFQRYAEITPDAFRFGLKATERTTVFRFPRIARYGKDAGTDNAGFLDPTLFQTEFLRPLENVSDRLSPILLEFSEFRPGMLESGGEFVERLDYFFAALRNQTRFRFSVELRNRNWLKPAYFEMLARHGVSHVYNSWTRMPSLAEQLELASPYALPSLVSRVLLQPGTKYEEAVEAFSPYDKVVEEQPLLRQAIARLIKKAIDLRLPAYIFVNNRAEGCAPRTIEGVLACLEQDGLFD